MGGFPIHFFVPFGGSVVTENFDKNHRAIAYNNRTEWTNKTVSFGNFLITVSKMQMSAEVEIRMPKIHEDDIENKANFEVEIPSATLAVETLPSVVKNFRLYNHRLYENSTLTFQVKWEKENCIPPAYGKYWEAWYFQLWCKFFVLEPEDYGNTLYPESCLNCLRHYGLGETCLSCWNETPRVSEIGPYFTSNMTERIYSHGFQLQTYLPGFEEGIDFFDIGGYEAEMKKLLKMNYLYYHLYITGAGYESPISKHMRNNIFLPSEEAFERAFPLNKKEINNLHSLCAMKTFTSNGASSEWSEPIKLSFGANYFPDMICYATNWSPVQSIVEIYPKTNFLELYGDGHTRSPYTTDISQNGLVTAKGPWTQRYYDEKPFFLQNKVGCFHWMLNTWFVFWREESRERNETTYEWEYKGIGKYVLMSHEGPTGDLKWQKSDYPQENNNPFQQNVYPAGNNGVIPWNYLLSVPGHPTDIKCAQLHELIVWTELDIKTGEISTHKLELNFDKNGVLSTTPKYLRNNELCGCSIKQNLQLPVTELVYPDVLKPDLFEIVSYCENVLCAISTDQGKNQSHRSIMIHESSAKNLTWFGVSMNNLYYLTSTSKYIQKQSVNNKSDLTTIQPPHTDGNYIRWFKVLHQLEALPVPYDFCMYPFPTFALKTMVNNITAQVKIAAIWNSSAPCHLMAKPKITYVLKYAVTECNDSNTVEKTQTCKKLSCIEQKSGSSRNKTTNFFIKNLFPNRWYLLEAAIILDFPNNTVKQLWYGGKENNHIESVSLYSHYTPRKDHTTEILIGALVPTLLLIIGLSFLAGILIYERWYKFRELQSIKMSQLTFLSLHLGKGRFGSVQKAVYHKSKDSDSMTVAVKTLSEDATDREKRQLVDEALILGKIDNHDHIIKILGFCFNESSKNQPVLVLEFMEGGGLDKFLQNSEIQAVLKKSQLWKMCHHISQAGVYLSQKGIVHRDIAARNCLLQYSDVKNFGLVKLTDFGLAKAEQTVYQSISYDAILPIFWMAPESLNKARFTAKSDVWSFGVLMWEIFSAGSMPYGKCSYSHECPIKDMTADEVSLQVSAGKTLLDFPFPCCASFSPKMLKLMKKAWHFSEDERATFKLLEERIHREYLFAIWNEKLNDPEATTFEEKKPLLYRESIQREESHGNKLCPAYASFSNLTGNYKDEIVPYNQRTSRESWADKISYIGDGDKNSVTGFYLLDPYSSTNNSEINQLQSFKTDNYAIEDKDEILPSYCQRTSRDIETWVDKISQSSSDDINKQNGTAVFHLVDPYSPNITGIKL